MDCALILSGIAATYVVLDQIVPGGGSDCSCPYTAPEKTEHFQAIGATGDEFQIRDGKPVHIQPAKHVELQTPVQTSRKAATVPGTTGIDMFGNQDTGDLGYSQVPIDSMKPMKEREELKPRAAYGEVFVDPEAWHPPCMRPPVCTTSNGCPVQPVFTNGTYVDLLEWDNSRRITPPMNINTEYVNNVLNSGLSKAPQTIPAIGS
jgi:hypothetical protein